MRRWIPLLLLAACGPVTGVSIDAAPDVADVPLAPDAPVLDAQEAAAPDVAPEAAPDAPRCTDDVDRDGHLSLACGGDDCDDTNPRAYPGQQPRCDRETVDSDCNGVADAMEPARRGGRCSREAEGLGLSPVSVRSAICMLGGAESRCAACEGSGAARRCVCWENSSRAYQECSL